MDRSILMKLSPMIKFKEIFPNIKSVYLYNLIFHVLYFSVLYLKTSGYNIHRVIMHPGKR